MSSSRRLLPLALAIVALLIVSATMALQEARPFLLRAAPLDRRISAVSDPSSARVSILESRYARSARLEACLTTLREIIGLTNVSLTEVNAVTQGCLLIAEEIVADSPLDANAWFIAATLAAQLNDYAKVARYLKASYRTGDAEQWIAERRALFAYGVRDRLDDDLKGLVAKDFALLLQTNHGVDTLAGEYISDPSFREYLTEIAESLDEFTQKRFLSRVQEGMR